IEQFDQLGEVRQGSRQAVDLVDHDDIDLSGSDVFQQPLQIGTVGRPAGISIIVVPGSGQSPTGMGLTLYVGGGCLILGVQRVELLIEALVGGDPGINSAAED